MRLRKGDTLIEVAIAVGIFSLVSVTIVQVIYSSISGAQTSLETTIVREEMDAQAEAIRFIHEGYSSGSQSVDTNENVYTALWNRMIQYSNDEKSTQTLVSLHPTTCDDLYNKNTGRLKAYGSQPFVVNNRRLGDTTYIQNSSNIDNVIIKNVANGSAYGFSGGNALGPFYPASTYPRILYGARLGSETLLNQAESTSNDITRVEGLFIVPTRGSSKMSLYGSEAMEDVDFYDFYISACWMTPGSERPSTLATVVRLYDYADYGKVKVTYNYTSSYSSRWPNPDPNAGKSFNTQTGKRVALKTLTAPKGWTVQWYDTRSRQYYAADGTVSLINNDPATIHQVVEYNMVPVYKRKEYKITYNINYPYVFDGTMSYSGLGTCRYSDDKGKCSQVQICYMDEPCVLKSPDLVSSGYKIKPEDNEPAKWCVGTTDSFNGTCSGKTYNFGKTLTESDFSTMFSSATNEATLKAVWKLFNETYEIVLDWKMPWYDLDAHIEGTKSNGKPFHSYFGSKAYGENINGNQVTITSLDIDCTGGCNQANHGKYIGSSYIYEGVTRYHQVETFTLNTLGGRDYYFYVHNFTEDVTVNNYAKVTVKKWNPKTGKWKNVKIYQAKNASGIGRYWNVFAYKNGVIVDRNTRSSYAQISY